MRIDADDDPIKMLCDLLRESGVRVAFGLTQQGHMQTVDAMLAAGQSWDEIGKAIGWCPEAAERYYRMETQQNALRARMNSVTLASGELKEFTALMMQAADLGFLDVPTKHNDLAYAWTLRLAKVAMLLAQGG